MNENKYAIFSECGQPQDKLQVVTSPVVHPVEGEVMVRMLAAPINPADINFVQGVYGLKPVFPNSRAGLEGCGVVEESCSPDFIQGDQVIMLRGIGSWSRYLTAPADHFLKLEVKVDPIQGAMLKVNPLTALRMLEGFVSLKPSDWIVQNASNSGVGRCIIQIAKKMGVKTINFVRRADDLRDELMALGADIIVGEGEDDVVKKTLELTGGMRPMLASNAVGGESALRLMDMLAPGGTMVTFGAMSKKSIKVPNGFLIFKGISLRGLWVTQWLKTASKEEQVAAYGKLSRWMASGELTQAVDTMYEIEQIRDAATKAQEEFRNGKIVLNLGA
ncbi:MAG: 2-enoyl thioester reductase domain-containing protein [Akkermansia sp.]